MILTPVFIVGSLGLFFGLLISLASKKLSVHTDYRITQIQAALPSTNCGMCGYPGCSAFAKAATQGKVDLEGCIPGGPRVAHQIAEILEAPISDKEPMMAVVHCKGGTAEARQRAHYDGLADCRAAVLCGNGSKTCADSCLGLGTCVRSCPFHALRINDNGVAIVDPERCNGCGACIPSCPRAIISLIPRVHKIFLACANHEYGAKVKEYCSVGCTACSICVSTTSSGAISMVDNLPQLDYSHNETFVPAAFKCPSKCFTDLAKARPKVNIDTKCDGCGACVEICPVKGTITGEKGLRHIVNKEKCIGCGLCLAVCPVHAISLWGGLGYNLSKNRHLRGKEYK
jgi:electron transport complex protein RnfB